MEKITTVGIDLAKSVFSLHGVDGAGRAALKRTVRRDKLMEAVAAIPPCLIGMEACSGAHEWGRRFQAVGHTVRLMAPKFVAPYRKSEHSLLTNRPVIVTQSVLPSSPTLPLRQRGSPYRHIEQWQLSAPRSGPVTSYRTPPQRQLPRSIKAP